MEDIEESLNKLKEASAVIGDDEFDFKPSDANTTAENVLTNTGNFLSGAVMSIPDLGADVANLAFSATGSDYRVAKSHEILTNEDGTENGWMEAGSLVGGVLTGSTALKGTVQGGKFLSAAQKRGKISGLLGEAALFAPVDILKSEEDGGILWEADEDDSAFVGKMKSAAEGMALGFGASGLLSYAGGKLFPKVMDLAEPTVKQEAVADSTVEVLTVPGIKVDPQAKTVSKEVYEKNPLWEVPDFTEAQALKENLLKLRREKELIKGNKRVTKKLHKNIDNKIRAVLDALEIHQDLPTNSLTSKIPDIEVVNRDYFDIKTERDALADKVLNITNHNRRARWQKKLNDLNAELEVAWKKKIDADTLLNRTTPEVKYNKQRLNTTKAANTADVIKVVDEAIETLDSNIAKASNNTIDKYAKQSARVSKEELKESSKDIDNFMKHGGDSEIDGYNPTPHLKKTRDVTGKKATQMRNDMINLLGGASTYKVTGDVNQQEVALRYLQKFSSPGVHMNLVESAMKAKGPERTKIMQKVYKKFHNNPTLLPEENFNNFVRFSEIISEDMGLPKKTKGIFDSISDVASIKKFTEDADIKRSINSFANIAGITTDDFVEFATLMNVGTEGLPKLLQVMQRNYYKVLEEQVSISKSMLTKVKKSSDLDLHSDELKDFLRSLAGSVDVFVNTSGARSNMGRAFNALRTSGQDMLSMFKVAKDADKMTKESRHVVNKHIDELTDTKLAQMTEKQKNRLQKQLFDLIERSANKAKAAALAKEVANGEHGLDIIDMIQSTVLGNTLANFGTIGNIGFSTGMFFGVDQFLKPAMKAIMDTVTTSLGGRGPLDEVNSLYSLSRRAVGLGRTLQKYGKYWNTRMKKGDYESILGTRGVVGLQVEGTQAYNMTKDAIQDWIDMSDSKTTKAIGKVLKLPLAYANMWTRNLLIPVDDFYRRAALDVGNEASVINTKFIMDKAKNNPFADMDKGEFRKVMLPLLEDIHQAADVAAKDWTLDPEAVFDEVFRKYGFSGKEYESFRNVVKNQAGEVQHDAARVVAQQGTDDSWGGKGMNKLNEFVGDNKAGRLVLMSMIPFQSAPVNLMEEALEYTPGLQPLSRRFWRNMNGSPKQKREAVAKMMTGSAMAYGFWELSGMFEVHGKLTPKERTAISAVGGGDYTIKVGDTYYSYNFLGPMKYSLAMMGDLRKYDDVGERPMDEWAVAFTLGALTYATSTFTDTPHYTGIEGMSDFLSDTEGEEGLSNASQRMIASKLSLWSKPFGAEGIAKPALMFKEMSTGARTSNIDRTDALVKEQYETAAHHYMELNKYNLSGNVLDWLINGEGDSFWTTKTNVFGDPMFTNGPTFGNLLAGTFGIRNTMAEDDPVIKELVRTGVIDRAVPRSFEKLSELKLPLDKARLFQEKTWESGDNPLYSTLLEMALDTDLQSRVDPQRLGEEYIKIINQRKQEVIDGSWEFMDVRHSKNLIKEIELESRKRTLGETSASEGTTLESFNKVREDSKKLIDSLKSNPFDTETHQEVEEWLK